MHASDWLNLDEEQANRVALTVAAEYGQPFKLISVIRRDLGHKSVAHVIVQLKDGTKKGIEL